ncbi:homoserine dehydrogenase [Canibacter sp. lx-72]|uniref:homoserine dehydrogenase n=1 Tax=Canibacter zhuwentaonis TaxID=2837491 RepID=UPI001BDD4654|nr:homoserine dehydrogenase [Canibacter zhuwentaonis]MBT1017626.1 homoserine dehydrogenase [Canibacter zhuwentaonis]
MGIKKINVALLGAGSVGAQLAARLLAEKSEFAARSGVALELIGIAVRNPDALRDVDLPKSLFTDDATVLINKADLIVELIGGIEPARGLILGALQQGKDVVTANKALLAKHGDELEQVAAANGAQLFYEAAVCGAIPIVRVISQSLAGDNIKRVMGIVNGSTNYILDQMHIANKTTAEAVQEASDLGYLEADPTLDVEGYDAAQKAAILARLAFHTKISEDAVYREGITTVTATDVAVAKANRQVIKLLAIAERVSTAGGESAVAVRVYPALLSADHPLAKIGGGTNAVYVDAECAGELVFVGAGAGGIETASAVLGDIVTVARQRIAGGVGYAAQAHLQLPELSIADTVNAYQVRLPVRDVAQARAQITEVLVRFEVAVRALAARESAAGDSAADAAVAVSGSLTGESATGSVIAGAGAVGENAAGAGAAAASALGESAAGELVLVTEQISEATFIRAADALASLEQVTGKLSILRVVS